MCEAVRIETRRRTGAGLCRIQVMRVPFADDAIVEDAKLLDYALNPDHPVGRHHARLFDQLLGLSKANAPVLKAALLKAVRTEDARIGQASPHGTKYEVRFTMMGPVSEHRVLSVWLLEPGLKRPRLITCYVE